MRPMAHALRRPRKTVQDYLALPDGVRAELVQGEIYGTPSPTPGHQESVGTIYAALRAHGRARGTGRAFVSPLDVHLSEESVVQPDVLWLATGNPALADDAVHGVPDLVVEVVSPSHPERDRFVKRSLYEEHRVPELWLVDPSDRSVEVLRFSGDRYAPAGWFVAGQVLVSPSLPGFELPVEDLFSS
jgi:Uma2 family endonuclease